MKRYIVLEVATLTSLRHDDQFSVLRTNTEKAEVFLVSFLSFISRSQNQTKKENVNEKRLYGLYSTEPYSFRHSFR